MAGVYGDAIRIRLTAPPVDGAANEKLVDFLADVFSVARRGVTILAGETSRSKIVEIEGITEQAVHAVAGGHGR